MWSAPRPSLCGTVTLQVLYLIVVSDPVAHSIGDDLAEFRVCDGEQNPQRAIRVARLQDELIEEIILDKAEQGKILKDKDQFHAFAAEQLRVSLKTSSRVIPASSPIVIGTARRKASFSRSTAGPGSRIM